MLHYMDILKSPIFLDGVMGWLLYITHTYIVVIIYISLNDFREKVTTCLCITVCGSLFVLVCYDYRHH